MDVMVISEYQGFPGCIMDCRIIGCMQVEQSAGKEKIRNDRYIGILEQSNLYEQITSIEQLPVQLMTEIELFFKNYIQAEGKEIKFLGQLNALQAMTQLQIANTTASD